VSTGFTLVASNDCSPRADIFQSAGIALRIISRYSLGPSLMRIEPCETYAKDGD
jgi:hypothetical protein